MLETHNQEIQERLELLYKKLKGFYDPDYSARDELLSLLGTAIMTYLDHPRYQELPSSQRQGYKLITLYRSLDDLLLFIEKDVYA